MKKTNYSVWFGYVDPQYLVNRTLAVDPLHRAQKSGFFYNLENSIRLNGIRNPIQAVSDMDLYTKKKTPGFTYVDNFGGSRLYVAQKLNIKIPVIITSYGKTWNYLTRIKSVKQALAYFSDKPKHIAYESHQFYFYQ